MGRLGTRPLARDLTSSRVVPGEPALRNTASAMIVFFSRTVPEVAMRSTDRTQRFCESSAMSRTTWRGATRTWPVASAAARYVTSIECLPPLLTPKAMPACVSAYVGPQSLKDQSNTAP